MSRSAAATARAKRVCPLPSAICMLAEASRITATFTPEPGMGMIGCAISSAESISAKNCSAKNSDRLSVRQ